MAYEVKKEKDRQAEGHDPGNPYDAMVGGGGSFGSVAPTAGSVSRTAPAAPAGPAMMNASGPTATGYVNFDSLYNANAGVAQREATQRANAAEAAGQKATQARTGAQQGFTQATRTGATQGPQSTDYEYAAGQRQFYDPAAFVQAPSTGGANALAARGSAGAKMQPEDTREVFENRLKTGAQGGYWGPDSLSETDGYDELLKQTEAAQQQATNPLVGLNQTDAALLGAAGQPRFAEVEAKYGGLKDELDKANTASVGQAKAARAGADKAADEYGRLLSEYEANKPKPGESPVEKPTGYGYQPGGFTSYEDFKNKVGTGADIHDAGMDMSPVDAALTELGRSGLYGGQTVAGTLRNATLGDKGDGIAGSLDDQNRLNAFRDIESQYGPEAVEWLWQWMTEGLWNGMSGQNSGAMHKTLADLVEQGIKDGSFKPKEKTPLSEQSDGYASTPAPPPAATPQPEDPDKDKDYNQYG